MLSAFHRTRLHSLPCPISGNEDLPASAIHPSRAASYFLRRAFARSNSGQALLETALSLITAFTLSFAVFEFSMVLYTYCAFNEAVREGVRYAIIHGTSSASCSGPSTGCGDATADNVKLAVMHAAPLGFESIQSTDVIVTYAGSSSAPASNVTVTLTKAYVPLLGFLGIHPTLSASSQGRILY